MDLKRELYNLWRGENDFAITLYYMFLLQLKYSDTKTGEIPSLYDDLVETTTLASNDLSTVIRHLKRIGAISDEETCHLVPAAINTVEDLFQKTFGTSDPDLLRYNGLELQRNRGGETYRVKHWVEKASDEIYTLFSPLEGFPPVIKDLDVRKSKRIVTLNLDPHTPLLSFMFMSTSGMSKNFEVMDLIVHENEMMKWRAEKTIQDPIKYPAMAESHISIIAAISYQPNVANEQRTKGMHSTGPLNFEALTHYFRERVIKNNKTNKETRDEILYNNIELRTKQYHSMVEAYKTDRGGVAPWFRILSHIEYELRDYYASVSGLDQDWKDKDWLRIW